MTNEVRDEIIIGGTPVKYVGPAEITYERVREEWSKARDGQIVNEGAPITWETESGETGILRPGGSVKAEDGLRFKVDSGHLS